MANERMRRSILGTSMQYRKFSADRIFDGTRFLPDNGVIITDKEGRNQEIVSREDGGDDIEVCKGIITPGMINSHCHVELSYLKGRIPSGKGLIDFLLSVIAQRKAQENREEILEAMTTAIQEMTLKGIMGVGDIANTDQAIRAKLDSSLHWHTFIEMLNFFDDTLPVRLSQNESILNEHLKAGLKAGLTPHSPYTVSKKTLEAINDRNANVLVSIHNQETEAENELFYSGKGDFLRLFEAVGLSSSPIEPSGKTSVQTYLPYFNNAQKLLLVHNTYINEEDILLIKEHEKRSGAPVVFCLCPNANLYIENTLPPVNLLLKHSCTLVLGTDSYASNHQLSIAQEVKTLLDHFPQLSTETVLQWACSNGADVFGWVDLGSIKKGKKPGLVLLEEKDGGITGNSSRLI